LTAQQQRHREALEAQLRLDLQALQPVSQAA
jgi:hypothetical protein